MPLLLLFFGCNTPAKTKKNEVEDVPEHIKSTIEIGAERYTLAWRNSFAHYSSIVTVNGEELSPFSEMQRIDEVRVLQFPDETLYVFSVWGGGMQNLQLMLVRLSDSGVSVIGPTPINDQFERIEIIPTKKKGSMGSLLKLYISYDNEPEPKLVAVYQYSEGGYLTKLQPAAAAGGVWYQAYSSYPPEARIAEAIAAALAYEGLDPEAREVLAGVIKSDADMVQYGVLEAHFPDDDPDTYRIGLTIGESIDEDGDWGWSAVWLVEIRLWHPHFHGSPYVIESVTLSLLAG